jgi:demethoxyubiquinone hydroxylase (CLK1/Coq7/Cat5 family)
VWFEKIKNIITSNSESRIAKQEVQGQLSTLQKNEMREIIDELWRNEILLNWQSYFDPLNRKLRTKKVAIHYDEKDK